MNRKQACYALLERALIEPISVEMASNSEAKAARFTCYHIRQALRLGGDSRFDKLSFRVHGPHLTIEERSNGQSRT